MRFALFFCLLIACVTASCSATVLKVIPPNPPSGYWDTSYHTLEDAIDLGNPQPGDEIWVAAGTYDIPDEGINVPEGVSLYGGFVGTETTEAQRDERHPRENETVLYSDYPGTNMITVASPSEVQPVIDGFTIEGGAAGVRVSHADVVVSRNVFRQSWFYALGCFSSNSTISCNTFETDGSETSLSIDGGGCTVWSNYFTGFGSYCGNAIEDCDSTSGIVNNTIYGCNVGIMLTGSLSGPTIVNNIITYNGVGIFSKGEAMPDLYSNCFWEDYPDYDGVDPGETDFDADPKLTDGYKIPFDSPCHDAGDPDRGQTKGTDIDGHPRWCGGIDVGAYEFTDTTPPSLSGASLTSPDCTNESPISVQYSGVTDDNAIGSVTLWYRKDSSPTWTLSSTIWTSNSSGSFDFVPAPGNGTYHFAISAGDWAGNGTGTPTSAMDEREYAGTITNPDGPQIELNYEGEYTFSTDFWCTWRIASGPGLGNVTVGSNQVPGYYFGLSTSPCASATPDISPGWVTKAATEVPYWHGTLPTGGPRYIFVKATDVNGHESVLCRDIAYTATDPAGSPLRPTGLSATAASNYTINLEWTDNSSDEDGFYVERRISSTYPYVTIAALPAGTQEFVDNDLRSGTSYTYRVRSYRYDQGVLMQSCCSDTSSATTVALSSATIPPPSDLVATAISATEVVLTWARGNVDLTGIRTHVERRPVTVPESPWTDLADTGYYAEYYCDSGLASDTAYEYQISSFTSPTVSSSWYSASVTTPSSPACILSPILDNPTHPRLLITPGRLADVKAYIDPLSPQHEPRAEAWYNEMKGWADYLAAQSQGQWLHPPQDYVGYWNYTGSKEYMYLGSEAMANIALLAAMYLVTEDEEEKARYGARGVAELMEGIKSAGDSENPPNPSWGDPSADDTWIARRIAGIAIGYDWLYDLLTSEQKATVAAAIKERGLGKMTASQSFGWLIQHYNHCMTPNAGTVLGALTIAGDIDAATDAEAGFAVARAIGSTRQAIHSFDRQPYWDMDDGGAWCEGPLDYFPSMYDWVAYQCCAMETALGISADPGSGVGLLDLMNHEGWYEARGPRPLGPLSVGTDLHNAAKWTVYMTHPRGTDPYGANFNFADARTDPIASWGRLYFADKFSDNLAAWQEEQGAVCTWDANTAGGALDLLWFRPVSQQNDGPVGQALPLAARFTGRGIETVSMRSAWQDADATVVGVRGGSNTANHGHADLGTFVLDALGFRWAEDLGGCPTKYDAMWDNDYGRWIAEGVRTDTHNAIVIDGQNQSPIGEAPLALDTTTDDHVQEAVVDLTGAYRGQASSVLRRISLINRGSGAADVVVADRVRVAAAASITTGFMTPAEAVPDGATLELRQGDPEQTYYARLISPAGASWFASQLPYWMPEKLGSIPGTAHNRVEVVLPGPCHSAEFTYVFSPSAAGDITPPVDIALDVDSKTSDTVTLSWDAPGDDGTIGTATAYDIRYSLASIDDTNWSGAVQCTDEPAPAPHPTRQTFTVTGLSPNTTYYFAIRAVDDNHNWNWVSTATETTNPP